MTLHHHEDMLDFDADWYCRHYPAVGMDLAAGRANTPIEHYERFGRARGYLRRRMGIRPANAASYNSAFGGLWTDLENAHDIISGKHDLGWLTESEAADLHFWVDNGYVKIDNALDEDMLLGAKAALETAYAGDSQNQVFEGGGVLSPYRAEHATGAAKALCIHWLSPIMRDAMFAPKIARFLALIFERPALASQTLGFHRGSGQGAHQDTAYVGYSLQMQFAASWIALEDTVPGAGELFYYPGSHRLPDFLLGGEFKNFSELMRLRLDEYEVEAERYDENLSNQIEGSGLIKENFYPKAGDALIWSANLIHGGSPVSSEQTRQSLVTHYCPIEVAPLHMEVEPRDVRRHKSGHYYTTYNYGAELHEST